MSKGNTGVEAPDKSIGSAILSFESNGGNEVEAMEVTTNTKVGRLPVPKQEGLIFDGWYMDSNYKTEFTSASTTDKDIALYAKWEFLGERPKVLLNFDSAGGSLLKDTDGGLHNVEVSWDIPVGSLPVPEKEGYIFKGWYIHPEGTERFTEDTKIQKETTVYAKWEEITGLVVSFDTHGGAYIPAEQFASGQLLEALPEASRKEYVFDGWFADEKLEKEYVKGSAVTEDMVLYAKWVKKGDIDLSDSVDANDALMILKRVANIIQGFDT